MGEGRVFLLMVVYHSLNFQVPDSIRVYRLPSPSFIFVSGFC